MPSLDTPTCDTETRRFNQEAAKLGSNAGDLDDQPRSAVRAEALVRRRRRHERQTLSGFRERAFGPAALASEIKDGLIAGLTARAVSWSVRTAR